MIECIAIVIPLTGVVIAALAFRQNSRKIKADKRDKYGAELYEIQNSISDDLNRLSHIAGSAYEESEKYLDKYLNYQ